MKAAVFLITCVITASLSKELFIIDKLHITIYNVVLRFVDEIEEEGLISGHSGQKPEVTIINIFKKILQDMMEIPEYFTDFFKYSSEFGSIQQTFRNFTNILRQDARMRKNVIILDEWKSISNVLNGMLNNIPNLLESTNNFIDIFKKETESDCGNEFRQTQMLEKYKVVRLLQLQVLTMIQFFNVMQLRYNQGKLIFGLKQLSALSTLWTNNTRKVAHSAMKNGLSLWKCDRIPHQEGQTYEQMTIWQGYIANEVTLNSEGSCVKDCNHYKNVRYNGCLGKSGEYCEKKVCQGNILSCKSYDYDMYVCHANSTSKRRYENIELKKINRYLGPHEQNMKCYPGFNIEQYWHRGFVLCEHCICICESNKRGSENYISLRPAMADIQRNRVITGIRFQKDEKIIHLQVQEGVLLPYGEINANTVNWVQIKKFAKHNRNVFNKQDYQEITWDSRSIALDEIKVNGSFAVTGVRFFIQHKYTDKEILVLEIYVTPFDFTTGKLGSYHNSRWYYDKISKRSELFLREPDISTKADKSVRDSTSNQYIKFTHTSFDKDMAQTVVPFFDIQNVESKKPVPLAGIGIIHRGKEGYGGFIAPSIISYNYGEHI